MSYLNLLSFLGIFGICLITWVFSENRRSIPWRVIIWGIGLQLLLGFLVFWFPPTKFALNAFSQLLNGVFLAVDRAAQFLFGPDFIPTPDRPANVVIRGLFVFRVLPPVIFFAGLMALLYNIGVIQPVVNFFAAIFYRAMRLSGAESLSGAANIFVGIEAATVVRPFLEKMTRSELCAILACCFGTAASSTLAIYVKALQDSFPNILAHLVSASIIAIPACFVISKILIPETETPLTASGIPQEEGLSKRRRARTAAEQPLVNDTISATDEDEEIARLLRGEKPLSSGDRPQREEISARPQETIAGELVERVSPLDAAILGALDGLKMAAAIAAVLIIILGLVYVIDQSFAALASLSQSSVVPLQYIGQVFQYVTLQNILGVLFFPLTLLTAVSDNLDETWQASVIIGRRLFETAIPPYIELGRAALAGEVDPRTVVIVSYALSGFAHLASVGIFVGGLIALIPSRRQDISELGWKALFVGTLATTMIACISGVFFNGDTSILGERSPVPAISPAPTATQSPAPTAAPSVAPSPAASPAPAATQPPTVAPAPSPAVPASPAPAPPSP
ncbi:MAG: nucleoside:proton symporter [Leptolyngbyaceae cyanobacterium RU_5_1]|nr:nucleoside:proton symporter [Leptolyngbyaceae cyanobacterium RU_5_1]